MKKSNGVMKGNVVLERLKVEYVRRDSVKPNVYNPNKMADHEFQLLLKSIKEDGWTTAIVCVVLTAEHLEDPKFKGFSVGDTVIVDGEHRWKAAGILGFSEIPVVKTSMTLSQMRIATRRHNIHGQEDMEAVAEVMRDLQRLGSLEWAKDSLGMDDVELNRLLNDVTAASTMASDEFSKAWEPTALSGTREKKDSIQSSTEQATSDAREAGKEARDASALETDKKSNYQVSLIFSAEEGAIIKSVLGANPAVRLLELCRREQAANPPEVTAPGQPTTRGGD